MPTSCAVELLSPQPLVIKPASKLVDDLLEPGEPSFRMCRAKDVLLSVPITVVISRRYFSAFRSSDSR
jgi:hypothetical protein